MRSLHCVWFVLSVFSFSVHATADDKTWESLIAKGNAAFQEKRLEQALQLYDQSLQAAGQAPDQRALSTHSLATVYQLCGDYNHAEVLYGLALGYWEQAELRPVELAALTYNNFGDLLTDKHQFVRARDMYAKALALWKNAKDPKPSRVAFAMSKLANAHNLNGESALAESLLKQAIEIHRKSTGPETLDLATSLDGLAKLYAYQRRFQQAEPLFQESLSVARRVMGEHDVTYAISLQNLATMHRLAGNGARAEPLLRKAAAIIEESLSSRHPYLAMVWNEQGMIALADKNHALAISYLQRAHDLSKEVFGPNHLRTVFAKGNLAVAYVQAGKLETAKKMWLEVLAAERSSVDIAPEEFARTLTNCGELSMMLHETKAAEGYFREAIPIWRGLPNQHRRDLGAALKGYARALKAGHDPEARRIEQEAKAFLETNPR